MAITWNETVQVSEAGQHWMEYRSTVYELLIDFLGNRLSLSLIADWSRDSRMKRVAEQYEAAGEIMNYIGGRSPEELWRLYQAESAAYDLLLQQFQPRQATQSHYVNEGCPQDVAECYATEGIAFNKLQGETDDHIAVELEFMTLLHDRMLDRSSCEHNMRYWMMVQESFLQEHLLRWAPSLCRDVRSSTNSPLYHGLVDLLDEFLV
ncbi:molecular chaperone, partial [Peribacillus sp. NPDC056705]|uniref:TorD/DmsD family molecular chaperone n=1 Tax=Peribacillus sp. NPDC056705 TaxID=3345918 RepID=UPI003749C58F